MLIPKLAFRNIAGAGVRTWLNVFVLSIAFVTIIWVQGLIEGMGKFAMDDMIDKEMGGGQFWHRVYDPYDPLTVEDAHARPSPQLAELVSRHQAEPILITTGAIFPDGRAQNLLIKGINPKQEIINLPTSVLEGSDPGIIPALIGTRMAKQTGLNKGDYVTMRWRDIHGTFDAMDIQIVEIMNVTVPSVDNGQVWIPIENLRKMLQSSPDEATLFVLAKDIDIETIPQESGEWIYRDLDYLLSDILELIKTKSASTTILYALLLGMALLAIFDTQVLAIFRRRKEMGTLMALGMTRGRIISLFTLEGAMHGMLALLVGAVYGVPLLYLTAKKGIPLPEAMSDFGVAISSTLYPSYGAKLLFG
ncbi:MAG: FtsX-like permease family protein, partial [Deltaproteobacteria bacterium]|nr:FtsX-like permease family protein [Deltaproteobacteria bacterium]